MVTSISGLLGNLVRRALLNGTLTCITGPCRSRLTRSSVSSLCVSMRTLRLCLVRGVEVRENVDPLLPLCLTTKHRLVRQCGGPLVGVCSRM